MRKLLLAAALCGGLTACNKLLFFLPELKDGKHYTQPVTQTDIDRGRDVAACLESWAHAYFSQPGPHHNDSLARVSYADVDFTKLVIVGVGDPGVAGPNDFVAGRENGDSIFVGLRVARSSGLFIAISRHEDVHIVQQSHHELIGADGDIHWAPPFDWCKIPRAIFL
jgi:hypothetical protein